MQTPVQQQQQGQPQYEMSDDDKKRLDTLALAWKAYDGELEKPLSKMPGQADDNVMSNACAPIVDTGVDFLFGKELEISVDENAPTAAQDFLDQIWGRKETRIPLLQDLAINGALAGRAFLRIVPVDDTYRLITIDPSIVFVQTSPQDCETVLLYCIQYSAIEKVNNRLQTVWYREEITRIARIDPDGDGDGGDPMADVDASWEIQHWTKVGDARTWTSAGSPIVWPYPFPPIFSCKNLPRPNNYWGKPDVTSDIIGMNNALNLVQSSISRNLKMFGQPILYANGFGSGTIDLAPGKIIELPLVESKITAVNLASDTANGLAFIENIRSDLDEVSGVPGVATGRMKSLPRGDMSGDAIELLYVRILSKTSKKQMSYGDLLINVSKALLKLHNMSNDIDIELSWQSPLPTQDLPMAQYAVLLKQIGVSDVSILRMLGFDPEEEMKLSQSEDAEKIAQMQAQGLVPVPNQQPQPGQAPQNNAPQQNVPPAQGKVA